MFLFGVDEIQVQIGHFMIEFIAGVKEMKTPYCEKNNGARIGNIQDIISY